jgi:hypothetical protein
MMNSVPLAGTAVAYTELPMFVSETSFFSLAASSTTTRRVELKDRQVVTQSGEKYFNDCRPASTHRERFERDVGFCV